MLLQRGCQQFAVGRRLQQLAEQSEKSGVLFSERPAMCDIRYSQWGSVYKRLALYTIKNEASIALYKEGQQCFLQRKTNNLLHTERLQQCAVERRLFLHLPLTVVTWRVGVKHNRWRFAHWCEYISVTLRACISALCRLARKY